MQHLLADTMLHAVVDSRGPTAEEQVHAAHRLAQVTFHAVEPE